jgi:hypothetical protein
MKMLGVFIVINLCLSFMSAPIELEMTKLDENNRVYFEENNFNLNNVTILRETSLLELTGLREGLYTVPVKLGSQDQPLNVVIDTGSFLLWVASEDCTKCRYIGKKFNYKKSNSLEKTKKDLSIKYISGSIKGKVANDHLCLNDQIKLKKFNFLLSDYVDAAVEVDGIIGLSRKYAKYGKEYSLIQNLYDAGSISRRMFSQKISDSAAKFYIGEMPEEIEKDKKNYTTCSAGSNDDNASVVNYWTCNANTVYIGDILIDSSTDPLIFDTGANVIIAPPKLYKAFQTNYFRKYLDTEVCDPIEDFSGSNGFICKEIPTDFPIVYLELENGKQYPIHSKYLFSGNKGGYMFKILFTHSPGGGWLLGQPFLKQYHVVFDQDKDEIGLYTTQALKDNTKALEFLDKQTNNESQYGDVSYTYLYGILGLALIVIIAISVFIVFRKKKENTQKLTLLTSYNKIAL